jgi:hypothetical protein
VEQQEASELALNALNVPALPADARSDQSARFPPSAALHDIQFGAVIDPKSIFLYSLFFYFKT